MRTMSGTIKRGILFAGLTTLLMSGTGLAQAEAVGFTKGMPFSEGICFWQYPLRSGATGTRFAWQSYRHRYYPSDHKCDRRYRKGRERGWLQMTDIVSVTVYVTDLDDVAKMNEVYKKLMPDPKPARATVQVAGLIGGAKIEISAIAVKH